MIFSLLFIKFWAPKDKPWAVGPRQYHVRKVVDEERTRREGGRETPHPLD